MIKTLQTGSKTETLLNIIKAIYEKTTANTILKVFPLRSGTIQEFLFLSLLFNIVLEV